MKNIQVRLEQRPEGLPTDDTWRYTEEETPTLAKGQMLVEQYYISLDPAMRGWVMDRRSYIPPVGIGEVMRAAAVGKVVESNEGRFPVGTYLYGMGGVQLYAVTDGKGWFPIDPTLAPLPVYTSALGMTGFTAYFGLLDVGQPKAGETVLVSAAAGAVGSMVGQIAKLHGCRVVGIAGSAAKCDYVVRELGFDACFNYKTDHLHQALKTHCPDGVDVYFDNVGGEILDATLGHINVGARIVICGAISQYNNFARVKGPDNYLSLLVNRARMEGFVILDYTHRYLEAAQAIGKWLAEGKIRTREHIEADIHQFQAALNRLFTGEKLGKLVLQVGSPA